MRESFRRFWFAAPEFRGLPLREKGRLLKLARSGRRIDDPEDRRRVSAYLDRYLGRGTRAEWALAIVLLVVALGLAYIAMRETGGWAVAGVYFANAGTYAIIIWWVDRRYRRTLAANRSPDVG
jgi:hypothetical protein